MSFNSRGAGRGRRTPRPAASLMELKAGEQGVLDRLELPDDISRRLMELGFLPGSPVVAAHSAPGGDPRVFRVDGAEIALRRETAAHLFLRNAAPLDRPES
ncbi:MAG TPA: FeoA family protein [Bryobacteraceae bacterium]|nr:FeoA family protein [Bryobacteraceae bacterium]